MVDTFIFSKEHLTILLLFSIFLYFCPKLTKNLLPYSYLVEKIICIFIVFEIALEQASLMSMNHYNVLNSLPIGIGRFTAYMCIAILIFKQYHLFNIFYSWTLVGCIGELILFKDMGCRFPNFIYFLYVASKCLLIYASVYMSEVRKFRVNRFAIKDNLIVCIAYFSFILLLNYFTNANYYYVFSSSNVISIFIFIILTSIIYIPTYLSNRDNIKILKKRTK